MAESYEVVLRQVAEAELHAFLEFIELRAQALSDLAVSESLGAVGLVGIDKSLIGLVTAFAGQVCVVEKLHEFKVAETMSIPLVLLRVLKYQDNLDVELSFGAGPYVDVDRLMLAMQEYIEGLSKLFHIKEFYGGLEPAEDGETRFFTGNALGPMLK